MVDAPVQAADEEHSGRHAGGRQDARIVAGAGLVARPPGAEQPLDLGVERAAIFSPSARAPAPESPAPRPRARQRGGRVVPDRPHVRRRWTTTRPGRTSVPARLHRDLTDGGNGALDPARDIPRVEDELGRLHERVLGMFIGVVPA